MTTAQQLGLVGNSVRVQALPTASAETFGQGNRYYTLIGQQEGYITGHTYHTIVANDVYSWEDVACGNYNMLDNIPVINQDLTASDFTPVANTYYRHTGSTTSTFTQGVIYCYDGTEYKALDGAGGISDVQVNGTSVVTDGVANIPVSAQNVKGVVSDVVRKSSQFKFITGTYSSGYLSPDHQSKGFVLSKDGSDTEFAIYPNTSWGNIIYAGYQNQPLHLYASVGDSLNYGHIGFYRLELRRYSSESNYNAISLPNISGTMMVAPSTWSSGTSGSLTLTERGTYQFYTGSATKTNYTLLYVELGKESIAYAGKNAQLEIDTNNVVHVYDMSQAEPVEVTVTLNYRRIGI